MIDPTLPCDQLIIRALIAERHVWMWLKFMSPEHHVPGFSHHDLRCKSNSAVGSALVGLIA
jgi:hypothetical protein